MKTLPQPFTSDGAVVHEEQDNRARMDDFRDYFRSLNAELAVLSSLTSNAVQQIFSTFIFPPSEIENISLCNNNH